MLVEPSAFSVRVAEPSNMAEPSEAVSSSSRLPVTVPSSSVMVPSTIVAVIPDPVTAPLTVAVQLSASV